MFVPGALGSQPARVRSHHAYHFLTTTLDLVLEVSRGQTKANSLTNRHVDVTTEHIIISNAYLRVSIDPFIAIWKDRFVYGIGERHVVG